MKWLILRVAVMVPAFLVGIAVDRAISRQHSTKVATPTPPVVAPIAQLAAVTAEPTPTSTPIPQMIFDFDPAKFSPVGGYIPIGKMPKEFSEFHSMALWIDEIIDGQPVGSMAVQTMVDKFDDRTVSFGLVTNRHVFFVTPPFASGFEYRFDGEFLRRDLAAASNNNIAVLKGTLTKTKKGRKVSESVITFRLEYDDC